MRQDPQQPQNRPEEEQKERADAGITPNPNPRANENINPNDQKDTTQTTGGEMTDGEDGGEMRVRDDG